MSSRLFLPFSLSLSLLTAVFLKFARKFIFSRNCEDLGEDSLAQIKFVTFHRYSISNTEMLLLPSTIYVFQCIINKIYHSSGIELLKESFSQFISKCFAFYLSEEAAGRVVVILIDIRVSYSFISVTLS